MFKGINVALITPYKDNLEVDYDTLNKLVQFHINSQTNGIVVLGTTGEAAALSKEEYEEIISFITKKVENHNINILVGVGTNSYKKTLENIKIAEKYNADGILLVSPYYVKPSQEALYEYFKNIASATKLPIILYDIPGRTGVKIDNDVIARLSKIENIVGIKDATGDILSMYDIYTKTDNFTILSGEDSLYYSQLNCGCDGVISVLANIHPREMKQMTELHKKGENAEAFKIFEKLYKVSSNLFIEGNPVTVKAYMNLLGMIPNMEVRLPLAKVSQSTITKLKNIVE